MNAGAGTTDKAICQASPLFTLPVVGARDQLVVLKRRGLDPEVQGHQFELEPSARPPNVSDCLVSVSCIRPLSGLDRARGPSSNARPMTRARRRYVRG